MEKIMKDKINVGIVGISNHGVTIRNAALRCEKINIVSAFDINTKELNKFAAEAKCKAAKDYDEIANDPTIDAVILVTPNFIHFEQVKKATDNKKHIFLEKPITNFVKEGVELVNYANKGGVILQIGHHMRYRVHYREAKKIIDAGKIGKVVSFYSNFSHDGGFSPNIPKWKMDKKLCPLLPMMQIGIHFIDSIQYLVGNIESLYCMGVSHSMPNGVVDSTVANLNLGNNIVGVMNCHYIIPSIFDIKIFGTKGTIYIDNGEMETKIVVDGKTVVEKMTIDETKDKDSAYYFEIADFADKVLKNEQPEVTGTVAVRDLAAIEAMAISVEEKREVRIDEVFQTNMIK
jgi:predicted dehydrogenase